MWHIIVPFMACDANNVSRNVKSILCPNISAHFMSLLGKNPSVNCSQKVKTILKYL